MTILLWDADDRLYENFKKVRSSTVALRRVELCLTPFRAHSPPRTPSTRPTCLVRSLRPLR